jgi:hypothetical protein
VRPNERAVLTHPTTPGIGGLPSERGLSLAASRPSHRLPAWRWARGTPSRSSTFSRGQDRQPGGRARDRAIAQCAAGDARPCGRPARSPQPRPESWHPSRAATAASTRTAVIEARAGRRPRHGHRCACPMTRIERARGDRIGRSALDPRDRPSALKEAGPMTTSVATTAPTEQTPRGSRAASSRTLTARPPCDLEGIRRSLTGIDCRSVQIEMAQRMIRYNRR